MVRKKNDQTYIERVFQLVKCVIRVNELHKTNRSVFGAYVDSQKIDIYYVKYDYLNWTVVLNYF